MNRRVSTSILTTLILCCVSSGQAGTIIKLSFGNDSLPDIELVGGMLSTAPDAVGATGRRPKHRGLVPRQFCRRQRRSRATTRR